MPTIPEAYAEAVERFRAGDLHQAESICAQIVRAVPDYADAWYFRGLVTHSLGQPERAIEYIRRALDLRPDDEEAHNNLGVILCDRGDAEGAIASLRRALDLRPDYAEAQNNLGVALKARGNPGEAVDCYREALRLAPDYTEAQLNLAAALGALGELDAAVASYRRALELDPADPVARHMLAAATGADVPDRASDQLMRAMFDRFAGSFDAAVERLGYRGPSQIVAALSEEHAEPARALEVLDVGCGTGLCGLLLRPYARRLVGVDLSPAMLAKARQRGVYDELFEAELTAYLAGLRGAFDVVASADTFIYFGALDEALAAASHGLRSGGLLVFTVEDAAGEAGAAGFRLHRSGRYRHGRDYLERTLDRVGLELRRITADVVRHEQGEPIAGLVVTARKRMPSA